MYFICYLLGLANSELRVSRSLVRVAVTQPEKCLEGEAILIFEKATLLEA